MFQLSQLDRIDTDTLMFFACITKKIDNVSDHNELHVSNSLVLLLLHTKPWMTCITHCNYNDVRAIDLWYKIENWSALLDK